MKNLVINWHITEACNYHCKFCFAKWNHKNEIWENFDNAKWTDTIKVQCLNCRK